MLNSPPSVLSNPWIQLSEGINPTLVQKLFEAYPLFRGESRLLVSIRCDMDINFLVTDVEIPADDDPFALLLQLLTVLLESHLVLMHLVLESFECFVASTGDVDHHQVEQFILEGENPALLTVLGFLQILENGERLVLGENGDAGVAG